MRCSCYCGWRGCDRTCGNWTRGSLEFDVGIFTMRIGVSNIVDL